MYRKRQMVRILEVAHLIHSEPGKWTRPRLAEHLGVNIATIQRDIDLLREMEFGIVAHGKQGYEMISDFFLPPLNLDFKEALALVTAADIYRTNEGKETIEILNHAIGKITSTLPSGTIKVLRQIVPQIEVPHRQISMIDEKLKYKEELYHAIRSRYGVTIDYNSFSSGKKNRYRILPFTVILRKNAWYVIGWSDKHNEVRTFRINSIESLQITKREYTIPKDFSIQKYLEKSWDIMTGPEIDVEVHFDPRVAPLIHEIKWHPSQKLHEFADGTLQFQVTVAGWEEIGRWILGWGPEAKVIKPEVLGEWVAKSAQEMVDLYTE